MKEGRISGSLTNEGRTSLYSPVRFKKKTFLNSQTLYAKRTNASVLVVFSYSTVLTSLADMVKYLERI